MVCSSPQALIRDLGGIGRVRARGSEYDHSMTTKVRKTLTLDPDLVEAFGDEPAALSATVNQILREEVERRARKASLVALVAELDDLYGPADPELVDEFTRLLS